MAAFVRRADQTGRGRDFGAACDRQFLDELGAALALPALAGPQHERAAVERAADAGELAGVAVDGLDRQRAGGEVDRARAAVRDDVDHFERLAAACGLRDLRERRLCRIEDDGADVGPQAAQQSRQVIDLRIDEGQFAGRVDELGHDDLLR